MSLVIGGIIFANIVGVTLVLFGIVYIYFQWNYQIWKRKNIPYFEPIFPYGNVDTTCRKSPPGDYIINIADRALQKGWKYFGMFLGGRPIFVPVDVEVIKSILTKDFNYFTDRGLYYNERDDPLSAQLLFVGGAKWKALRTKLSPAFTSGKIKGMFQTMGNCSDILNKHLSEHDIRKPVNIGNLLCCFTTDAIGSCAFGLDCNSFKEPNSPFIVNGKKLFNLSRLEELKAIFVNSFRNLSRAFRIKLVPSVTSKFYYEIVSTTVNYRKQNNYTRNDFLQLLLDMKNHNSGEPNFFTLDEIVAQCFIFFLAGFETSCSTMTFVLYELCLNSEIQEKVRNELVKVLEKYDNKLCYDAINEMVYMQHVIQESLRKYPALPFITRECVKDYNIQGTDISIDKGTLVVIPVKTIHYDERHYENPQKFDPDRFSSENKAKRHHYAHIPFGEGPRMCIGMRFGLMQSKMGLATILRNFRVKLNPKTKTPIEMNTRSFTPSIDGGLWVDLERI